MNFTKSEDIQVDRLSIGVPDKNKGNINRWKLEDNGISVEEIHGFSLRNYYFRDKDRPHLLLFM